MLGVVPNPVGVYSCHPRKDMGRPAVRMCKQRGQRDLGNSTKDSR